MSELLRIVRGLPKKYTDLLSADDLEAVMNDNPDGISFEGLQAIGRGRQDLGAGEYLDTATSIAGSIGGGALAGSVFGPVGAVVGGVVGGAVGAFGGELIEDIAAKRKIDVYGALKEGATSALIDTALLGTGKLVRPLFKAKRAPMPTLEEMRQINMSNVSPGSLQSNQSTQQMLQEGGGSLFRGQVQDLSLPGRIGESIARSGIISGQTMQKKTAMNGEILANNLRKQIGEGVARNTEEIGMFVFNTYEQGLEASKQLYKADTDKVVEELRRTGPGLVSTTRVKMAIDSFVNSFQKEWLDTLPSATRKTAEKLRGKIDPNIEDYLAQDIPEPIAKIMVSRFGVKSDPATLMELYRNVNQVINGDLPSNLNLSDATIASMSKLAKSVRTAIKDEIGGRSPNALAMFEKANADYALAQKEIFPQAIPAFVKKGKNEDWHALGKSLVRAMNPSQVDQLYTSIDRSYATIKKAKTALPEAAPQTAKDAKNIIKQSYLQEAFKEFLDDPSSLSTGAVKARNVLRNEQVLKKIAGDSYNDIKRIVNGIIDTATVSKNTLDAGALSIRSKEIASAGNFQGFLGAGALGASVANPVGGLLGAAAIFGIPSVLAKISTNPKAVNRFLFENARIASKQKAGGVVNAEDVASSIAKIMQNFSDSELALLEDEISRYGVRE